MAKIAVNFDKPEKEIIIDALTVYKGEVKKLMDKSEKLGLSDEAEKFKGVLLTHIATWASQF